MLPTCRQTVLIPDQVKCLAHVLILIALGLFFCPEELVFPHSNTQTELELVIS